MTDLLRPLKRGGTRTYGEEYDRGNQFAYDSEVDADFNTIYNAWNTMVPPAIAGEIFPPESISTEMIYPGETVNFEINTGADGNFWALSTPRVLAQLFLSGYRGGQIVTGGMLCLTLTNRKTPAAKIKIDLQLTLWVGPAPHLIGKFIDVWLPPDSTIPLGVPLSGMFGARVEDMEPTFNEIRLEGTKMTGADADTVVVDTGGNFYVMELA